MRSDGEIDLALQEGLVGAAEHGFVQLDPGVGPRLGKFGQAAQQQPGRENGLDRQAQFGFPVRRHAGGAALQGNGFFDQGAGAPVEYPPGLG